MAKQHSVPIPPEQRASKGPSQAKADIQDTAKEGVNTRPDHKGQQANSKINTTHQGYQQDR